jgi:hypothetical protein
MRLPVNVFGGPVQSSLLKIRHLPIRTGIDHLNWKYSLNQKPGPVFVKNITFTYTLLWRI